MSWQLSRLPRYGKSLKEPATFFFPGISILSLQVLFTWVQHIHRKCTKHREVSWLSYRHCSWLDILAFFLGSMTQNNREKRLFFFFFLSSAIAVSCQEMHHAFISWYFLEPAQNMRQWNSNQRERHPWIQKPEEKPRQACNSHKHPPSKTPLHTPKYTRSYND